VKEAATGVTGGGSYEGGGWKCDKMSNLGGSLKTVDWASQKISHFDKNFYTEDKCVTAYSNREIEEFRRAKEMKV
jgi:ATP-dependent RNA helicase DDX5/DBP2